MSKAMPADFTHLCHPILFLLEKIFKVSPTLEYYNTTIVGRSVKAYTSAATGVSAKITRFTKKIH